MQISDKLGQYSRNVSNKTEELRGAQSVQKLVSSMDELSAGNIFEGTVNTIKNGKVTLALGNGQVILARMDGKVAINPGSSMFFQVRSNDGTTIEIRPYTGAGNAGNPILLNALTAAGVPVTDKNLIMADMMMQEQMSVNRTSILNMVKLLGENPGANVQTVVQMTKLGIPVTEGMAAQFENYMSDRHAILGEMDLAMSQIAEALGDENVPAQEIFSLYDRILGILEGKAGEASPGNQGTGNNLAGNQLPEGIVSGSQPQEGIVAGNQPQEGAAAGNQLPEGILSGQQTAEEAAATGAGQQSETLGGLLNETQLHSLTKLLQSVPTLVGNAELFSVDGQEEVFVDTMPGEVEAALPEEGKSLPGEAVLNPDMTAQEFLEAVRRGLAENSQYGFTGIQKLFSGKEFHRVLKSAMEQKWLLTPEELKEGNKISRLYERMERQMSQVETAMKLAGVSQNTFAQTAADIRSNIDFMNQMNQLYTYMQVPLKLTGQNANGELYVYTNKKQLRDPEAELTAFLHLDLENIGATDVSVRLKNNKVNTRFYLSNQASYDLVEKHLPVLEKRLKNKGYSCTITIVNEKKEINFVEDFLKKDRPSAGTLHRYSFDVRA